MRITEATRNLHALWQLYVQYSLDVHLVLVENNEELLSWRRVLINRQSEEKTVERPMVEVAGSRLRRRRRKSRRGKRGRGAIRAARRAETAATRSRGTVSLPHPQAFFGPEFARTAALRSIHSTLSNYEELRGMGGREVVEAVRASVSTDFLSGELLRVENAMSVSLALQRAEDPVRVRCPKCYRVGGHTRFCTLK